MCILWCSVPCFCYVSEWFWCPNFHSKEHAIVCTGHKLKKVVSRLDWLTKVLHFARLQALQARRRAKGTNSETHKRECVWTQRLQALSRREWILLFSIWWTLHVQISHLCLGTRLFKGRQNWFFEYCKACWVLPVFSNLLSSIGNTCIIPITRYKLVLQIFEL